MLPLRLKTFRQENTKIIKKKIFNTKDWANQHPLVDQLMLDFKVTSDADFANTVEMKGVFSFGKSMMVSPNKGEYI